MSELLYSKTLRIRSEQVDMTRFLRVSELFRLMEEASIAHTEALGFPRQTTLDHYTYLQHEIKEVAMRLVVENWNIGPTAPIRAITVSVTHLVHGDEASEQLSLFDMGMSLQGEKGVDRDKQEKLEAAVDRLRMKHGSSAITLGFQKNEDIGIGR